jgi:cytochrome d ubiquinol oxidase subunit I
VAIGSNFSALWILIANGWMQNPVGAEFNPMTMRMEMTSFFEVLFNEVAQAKFVHTVSAGYVTAAVFVLGVSAWYLLKDATPSWPAARSRWRRAFGLASALSVVVLGDESGYSATHTQKMKLAAIEGMWETQRRRPLHRLRLSRSGGARDPLCHRHPWVMGLIGTRSLTTKSPASTSGRGIRKRIRSGIIAYDALMHHPRGARQCRSARKRTVRGPFRRSRLCVLLKRYVDDPREATPEQIARPPNDTIPTVWPLFWAFRIMVGSASASSR